ncbi:MAG: site-2 protease family protein [Anaerolineales bacterium]|nr:site-2 protease family protein [Anaerolineales bacterium]
MLFNLSLPVIISRVITLLIAFTVHEFAHAWSADQLGDDTPRYNGRLTFNPLAHLDIIGSMMLLVTGFGWAKPVPVNPYALQRRTAAGMMLVAIAGPISNLLMAITASIPFKMGLISPTLSTGDILPTLPFFLQEFIFINLVLFFFNLIPIYPLDGEKVLEYFLPPRGQETLLRLRPYGPMLLIAILFIAPLININILYWIVGYPAQQILNALVS